MAIGKKVRFEVFKRDSFTCQYCGKKAPDVILHVDHIQPSAKGGEDDVLNLVTACLDCNLGKGARALDDATVVEKRRTQLEELQERREQLDMMVEWQRSLVELDRAEIDEVADFWRSVTDSSLTDEGRRIMRRHLRNHGLGEVLEAIRIAASTYIERANDGKPTEESAQLGFSKVGGILFNRKRYAADPGAKARDDEMWRFVRKYHAECSHYPDSARLRQYWRQQIEPGLPADVAGVANAIIDACSTEYYDGRHSSYWDALQEARFPWEAPREKGDH